MLRSLVLAGLILAPTLVRAADPLQDAILRGAERVRAAYLDTGMSGLPELVDGCLSEARRKPSRAAYGQCVAMAAAAVTLDQQGAARFRMPPLLNQRALTRKTAAAFVQHGGRALEIPEIERQAAGCL